MDCANDEGKNGQPDHLFDGPARAADADVGFLEVLVRTLQLHPLSDQTAEHVLPDLFVLEREAVRVFEPLRTRVEGLSGLEEAGALRGRVGEGVDVVVVVCVVLVHGIRGMGWSGGEEEIAIRHGSERSLVCGACMSPGESARRVHALPVSNRSSLWRCKGDAESRTDRFRFP